MNNLKVLFLVLFFGTMSSATSPVPYFNLLTWELNSGAGTVEKIVVNSGGYVFLQYKDSNGAAVEKTVAHLEKEVISGMFKIAAGVPSNLQLVDKNPHSAHCANVSTQTYTLYKYAGQLGVAFYTKSGCHHSEPQGQLEGYLIEMKSILDGLVDASRFLAPIVN